MDIRNQIRRSLGRRLPAAHKGDFGRVFVLAGSRGMSGACFLASMAALRSGAGLVTVGVPKSLASSLMRRFTEAMMLALPQTRAGTLSERAIPQVRRFLNQQDVLAIGPGLSRNRATQRFIRRVVLGSKKPLVIDADGLNAFTGRADSFKRLGAPAILTPHPGEFVRLFGGSAPKGDDGRLRRTSAVAKKFGVTIILKGHRSIVAQPDGKTYVNRTGNPGMATGGSGDVLTGVIAGMLGQGVPPFQAACFGVFLHGLAGDMAARKKGQVSLVAGDILDALPEAFQKVFRRSR